MTKFEFLGDLSRLIADLPEEDREQAMEYYEDYFADAGPEREQEIIRDFISPAYIAEQLREASAQRQENESSTDRLFDSNLQKADEQPTILSRKSAALAARAQQEKVAAPTPAAPPKNNTVTAPSSVPTQNTTSVAQAPVSQQNDTTSASTPPTSSGVVDSYADPSQTPADPQPSQSENSSSMRNPIFQQAMEKTKEEEAVLELKKKTKVDIKSIHSTTSNIDKKQAKAAQKRSAEDKAYEASLYSGPKKALIAVLLLVTAPISLSLIGVILLLLLLALGVALGICILGGGCIVAGIFSLFVSILSLLTMHIPNFVLVLGITLLLFALGSMICYLDYKLFTHVIPGAYYSITVHINNIKAGLKRFAMKK